MGRWWGSSSGVERFSSSKLRHHHFPYNIPLVSAGYTKPAEVELWRGSQRGALVGFLARWAVVIIQSMILPILWCACLLQTWRVSAMGCWWGFSLGERLSSSNLWSHHSPYTLMCMPVANLEGLSAPAQLRYLAQWAVLIVQLVLAYLVYDK